MRTIRWLSVLAVLCSSLAPAGAAEPIDLAPGGSVIVTHGDLAWLVYAPLGEPDTPIVVATFRLTDTPTPPPPDTVAGVIVLENQEDRTAETATVMDDKTWQEAAKKRGWTWRIEDKDLPAMAPLLAAVKVPLPVVCFVDADGKVVSVVPLPATVEEMRTLIGGAE